MKNQWRETLEHEFDQLVDAQSDIVLVYFYAPWCDASNRQGAMLRSLPTIKKRHVRLLQINVDNSHDLLQREGIQSVPSLALYEQGRMVHSRTGLASDTDLSVLLAEAEYRIDASSNYQFDSSPFCRIKKPESASREIR